MTIRSIWAALVLAALSVASPIAAQGPDVLSRVVEETDGTRTLIHEATIDAPVDAVWATLSTADGWKAWGPREAWFDFRIGGSIETSYVAGAAPGDAQNIQHRILAYVPERMIALEVIKVPEGAFEPGVLDGMWGVYELEPLENGKTRLRILGLGYKSDETSSRILEFFKSGNAYSIRMLEQNLKQAGGQ
ncbi:SRPBCC family protein [Parerythrobacter jejuensis]|uniref:Activator of Hsp90 ATPase homologue 1/2-like C-terminal domain-containing protein n=1 Tax=Parerythrobacter jejuensis TaxID=795812 RepID=A0A845AUM7_9SPHN|nr:SRPBCC domain-containing protein [Parerythrobacter jejuensis]MXP30534.1 hypothetical protein [Parerythrobacter jejuensis]MXP33294.1 hypothetical protein [Parerythrobacter jejuensis]